MGMEITQKQYFHVHIVYGFALVDERRIGLETSNKYKRYYLVLSFTPFHSWRMQSKTTCQRNLYFVFCLAAYWGWCIQIRRNSSRLSVLDITHRNWRSSISLVRPISEQQNDTLASRNQINPVLYNCIIEFSFSFSCTIATAPPRTSRSRCSSSLLIWSCNLFCVWARTENSFHFLGVADDGYSLSFYYLSVFFSIFFSFLEWTRCIRDGHSDEP
jgi:hypothetical protein